MQFQFDMTARSPVLPEQPAPSSTEIPDLLRKLLEVQRDQLTQLRTLVSAHDSSARWRAFLARWRDDFPELAEGCRQTIPVLERTYGKLLTELAEQIGQNGPEALDNDFALQDFLDRYGMRLAQLGTLLSLVAPLTDAGPAGST